MNLRQSVTHRSSIVVGLDMDGVILNHLRNKMILAKKYGIKIKKSETPAGILATLMEPSVYKLFKNDLYDNPEVALNVSLMPGVGKFLKRIKTENIPFVLISARKGIDIPLKILKKNKLWPKFFNDKNVIFVTHKLDKDSKAKLAGVTHYIDDEPEVLESLISIKNKYLFDPYNSFPNLGYERLASWKDAHKKILKGI